MSIARRMWTLFEPLHAVTYFAPEARERFEAAGLRGFWRGYFAGRSAPLGAVDAAPVTAAFFTFAPAMVQRALPDVWLRATPESVLEARSNGAVAALEHLLGDQGEIDAVASLLMEAASQVDTCGRVLAAANSALPAPTEPMARLWHATTILREHRGDGHLAALVSWGIGGCEALVWRASLDLSRDLLQPARGWTDAQWDAATQRLTDRGWISTEGRGTAAAVAAQQDIEEITDRVAAGPWNALGETAVARLIELMTPLAQLARAGMPAYNPIGLPAPQ